MRNQISPACIVYLYGHILTPSSRFGHKHVTSKKRLDPVKFRKIIKLAMLVDLYNTGAIDFKAHRRWLGGKQLIVNQLKQIEPFDVTLEKQFATALNERGELKLDFRINKVFSLGFEEKLWMDRFAEAMNRELTAKGYLKEENGEYAPVQEAINGLEAEVEPIKRQLEEFRIKNAGLVELLENAL